MACVTVTNNETINAMFSVFEQIEGMKLQDIEDEGAIKHYEFIARLLMEDKTADERLHNGESAAYFNNGTNILLSSAAYKGQLATYAKQRNVQSNADKIMLYISFLNGINQGHYGRPLNAGIVEQVEDRIELFDDEFAEKRKRQRAAKEAENTTVIPEKNAASVFATRTFDYPVNMMDFRNDPKMGNQGFLSMYQALVYAKYINSLNSKTEEKTEIINEILETTDPAKLRTLWESYSISNPTILNRWQKGLKRLIVQLFERSFTENQNNAESIRQAIKFLETTKSKVAAENSDAIGEAYSALLTAYKDKLIANYVNKDRKVSFNDNLTIETIEANPQTVYVVAKEGELYKKIKANEEKGHNYNNVISIETEKDISQSEKVDVPPYYVDKIEKNDDVIMVYDSSQIPANGSGNALAAKEQGRIGENERVINRISDSGKAYGLNTMLNSSQSLNPAQILNNIKELYETAKENPDKIFAVAYTNTGTEKGANGYTGNELITMFLKAGSIPPNIKLSEKWVDTGRFGVDSYKKDVDNIVGQLKNVKGDIVIDGKAFKTNTVKHDWDRTATNSYEVSTAGDSRFSALNAKFAEGTIINGTDVSGMTIEEVYQKVIKKSGKGKAPAKDSIINITNFNPVGHTLRNPLLDNLPDDLDSKITDYIIGDTYTPTKEDLEDYSYYVGYLPLWQEWAKQNPELIEELRQKSKGKVLTDKFANTRVSQARALSDILNSTETTQLTDGKKAYNAYLHRQLSEFGGATRLEAEDEAIKLLTAMESEQSFKKVLNALSSAKNAAFDYLRNNDSLFKYKVPSYLKYLLFFGNGYVRAATQQMLNSTKIENYDVMSNVALYLRSDDIEKKYTKFFDENEKALFNEYRDWFKPKINSRTRAIIYMPERGFFANEQQYTETINRVVENAETVLRNGGTIVTLDYESLSSKVGEIARKEDSNKIIWNKLFEKGYNPVPIKGYPVNIWTTKETIAGDDEEAQKRYDAQLEKLKKKVTELKTFEPSVVTTTMDNFIDNEIIVSNKMFSTLEDNINKGIVTFDKHDPLYSQILAIQDTIANNPNYQHRVRFMLDGVIYYANIGYDDIIVSNEGVSIKGAFGRTRINGYTNVDLSFRDALDNPLDLVETHNPNIILGAEKAAEYISDITENLVDVIMDDINEEQTNLRERIAELEKELEKTLTAKLVNKYNGDVEDSEDTDEAAIKKELGELKKRLKKLNDGNYADFINDKMYEDEDGTTKPLGIESWVKDILSNRYEFYANLSEEDKKEEYADNVEFLIGLNDHYDELSDERDPEHPDVPSQKEQFDDAVSIEAQNMIEKEIAASREILTYFDDLMPYVYKNLSSRINIKIDTYREAETAVTDVEVNDNSFNATLADYFEENEDAITPVTEEEFVFRDNYQAELLDIAKSVSFEVKRKLFENVYVRSDDFVTSFYKVNSFGFLARKNRDEVYNFLRERLSGLHTLKEMIQWIEDYVDNGHFEYADLLRAIKEAPKNLQSKFFCCMYTQKANRQTHLNSKQLGSNNPNKIVDDIKDLRQAKMKQMTVLNLNTQNVLVEDNSLNLVAVAKDKRESKIQAITRLLGTTHNKFFRANAKYRNALKDTKYSNEDLKENNIFTSTEPEDVAIVEEVINSTRKILQAIGISVTNQQLRLVITSRKQYDDFYSLLTNSTHNGIFSEKNVLNLMNKDLSYDNFKFSYENIFEFLSPMYEEVPQKGTVHAAGKDFATYMYPSYASLLWDNLNDNSINPETGKRRNLEYIEKNFMQHPIFYKDDNLDEIIDSLKEASTPNHDYTQLIKALNKDSIRRSVIEGMYDADEGGYVLHLEKQNRTVKTEDAIPLWYLNKKIHEKIRETLKTARDLPEFCPGYKTEIWRNEWLKTIYLNYTNTYHKLKSEKWNKLQTVLLTMSNGKEYKDLNSPEFMQFLIDNYVTVARRTKNHFGAFYSPMVSDAETCRTEIFLNLHVSKEDIKEAQNTKKDALILAAAKRLAEVVEGETELRKQLLNKFIHRLEAYNAYNQYVESLPEGSTITRSLDSFKGYSEFIADFDITEKPIVYKKAANGLATISLEGLVFKEDGTLDYNKSEDALVERIKDFNGYTYNYVNYKDEGVYGRGLVQQCYDELESQFYKFLYSLDKNTTIPGKHGNYRVFKEDAKKTEEEHIEEDAETAENEEDTTAQLEENLEDTDEFNDEDDLYYFDADLEENKNEALEDAKNAIISTIHPAALVELKRFFFNQAYANTQLQQLFNTSPSFYKGGNPVELQKRGKEHNTPMQRLDLSDFIKPYQRVIYLKDLKVDNIDAALEEIIDGSDNLTDVEKANIKRAFKGMKIADGQAFRSPESYIKIQKGLGRWNDDMQAAYDRLCDPSKPVTFADIQMITMNPLKGFTFSMENVNLTPNYSIPMPVQHKDSEYTLLFGIAKARLKNNSVLQGLAEFMSRKDKDGDCLIDAAIFGTAVKVGGYGAIDLTKCKTAEDAKAILETACFMGDGSLKPSIVHEIPWKDYGIVSETPEHFFEEEALFGTQIRRIMYGDLELDKVYDMPDELNGTVTKMTGQEIIDKYSHLIEDNLKEAFDDLLDLFFTNDKGIEASAKLEKYLLREVTGNPLYPQDIAEYCKFDRRKTLPDGKSNPNYGKFTKLSNPKNYAKVQQLLLSLFKNRITKQKIAGGSCVQVSVAYDYNDLQLVVKDAVDSEGNVIIDKKTGKPKKVPVYAECYLPAYLESIYSKFLKKDGTIDLAKMEKYYKKKGDTKTFYALTNMIGYRIPTEGLSSTIKLKVKGFLTGYTGSSIILPKEIVTLSGSDFDIDKLYIHRYSFRNRNGYPELITKAETEDENKDVRNNELITMMMGIMTLPENNMLMIKPQGFENLKKSAMITNILSNPKYNYSVAELRDMDISELEKMASFEDDLSFLNPTTHVYFQQQNMVGKSLLGVWAVAKSAHCLFERSGLYLKAQYRFSYGENNFVKPDPITVLKNGKNVYVSTELGSYIGASADNAKDPVLAKLGITKDNINTVVYLARLGLDSTSIAIILKNRFFNKNSYYKLLSDAGFFTKDVKTEDAEKLLDEIGIDDIDINSIVFTDELMQSINNKKDVLDNETKITVQMKDGSTDVLTKQQLAFLINKLYNSVVTPAAEQLNQLTLSVRADSQNGAVSANMAETYSRIQQMEASERKLKNKDLTVFVYDPDGKSYTEGERKDNVPFFTTSFTGLNRSEDVDTKAAFVQKFMNYGVLAVRDLMRDKLPHFGATFRNAFAIGYHTRNGYISAENAKKLERALYYYHLGNLPFFGDEVTTDKKTGQKKLVTKDSKIDYYRDHMIDIYGKMLTKYPELNNNLFISLLSPDDELSERDKARGKIRTLRMPNSNLFPNDTKADIQNSFLQLLSSDNKDIVAFAWDLVRYGFYRYGFGFLPDGYMHLIPNEVFDSLEGYDDMLNKMLEIDEANALKNGLFIEDFILNNMSMIKSLNSMSWKSYIELQKEKKPAEIIDMFIKKYGELPPYMCFTSWDSEAKEVVYTLMKFNPYNLAYYPVKKTKEASSAKENKYFVKYRYYKNQPMINYTVDVDSLDTLAQNYEQAQKAADIYEASNFMTTIMSGLENEDFEEENKKNIGEEAYNNFVKQGYTALEMLSRGELGGYNTMLQDLSNMIALNNDKKDSNKINLDNANEQNSTAC